MCDRNHAEEWKRGHAFSWTADRRQFAIGALGALTACASGRITDRRLALAEDWVRIPTPDGVMDAFFVRPARGRHAAILT